jgi:hypothetical protein
MYANSSAPDPIDLASEAGGLMTGLSTLVIQLFPFAMPLLVLTVAPLAVLALAGLLIAVPIVLPLLLGRMVFRALRRRPQPPPVVQPQGSRLAQ